MSPPQPLPHRRIVVCGNGASAAALVHALARAVTEPTSVCVIGEGREAGQGIAYSTRNPDHLLNVPAGRMSIDPDEADHFQRWLEAKNLAPRVWEEQFLPRETYGRYLHDALAAAACSNPNLQLEIEWSEVVGLMRRDTGWTVSYRSGAVNADIVVLATGNDMPTPIAGLYGPAVAARIIDNPWSPLRIARMEDVLILGSALTAVDAVLALLGRGHRGRITLLSRRALLPHIHVQAAPSQALAQPWPRTARGMLRALRQAVGHTPAPEQWQGFMDAMRPHWAVIWDGFPIAERRRFLRHGAAIWSVHRHRLAPQIGACILPLLGNRIQKVQGRIAAIAGNGDGSLTVEVRGRDGVRTLEADRIVNCSGPNSDPEKTHDQLTENIIASRHARGSASGIGLDVDDRDRVVNRHGEVQPSLFAMGALTRGRWWEITAMPEIALQARRLAETLIGQLQLLRDAAPAPPQTDQPPWRFANR